MSILEKAIKVVDFIRQLKHVYDHAAWNSKFVNQSAATVEDYFHHFKYILIVDPRKALSITSSYPIVAFSEYEYPNRPRSEASLIRIFRVTTRNETDGKHYFDEVWGRDTVFVATNNEQDAVMITLRFT
jgi:hypothetical protein